MYESYFINEFGIYTVESRYGDDVEYIYQVRFDEKDIEMKTRAFATFVKHLRKEGAREELSEVKKQFKALFEFLA